MSGIEINNYPSCCALKEYDTCETIEESFKDIENFIDMSDVMSVKYTPIRTWLISSTSNVTCDDVLKICVNLFKPHRVIGVDHKGRTWNDDGDKFHLHLYHRLSEVEVKKIFKDNQILKYEQSGLSDHAEFNYWKNYVSNFYPSLASEAWTDTEDNEDQTRTDNDTEEDTLVPDQLYLEEIALLTPKEMNELLFGSPTIPKDNDTTISDELLCKICCVNRFDHAVIPCGYTICIKCSEKCKMKCPHCRGNIKGLLKLHF